MQPPPPEAGLAERLHTVFVQTVRLWGHEMPMSYELDVDLSPLTPGCSRPGVPPHERVPLWDGLVYGRLADLWRRARAVPGSLETLGRGLLGLEQQPGRLDLVWGDIWGLRANDFHEIRRSWYDAAPYMRWMRSRLEWVMDNTYDLLPGETDLAASVGGGGCGPTVGESPAQPGCNPRCAELAGAFARAQGGDQCAAWRLSTELVAAEMSCRAVVSALEALERSFPSAATPEALSAVWCPVYNLELAAAEACAWSVRSEGSWAPLARGLGAHGPGGGQRGAGDVDL